MNKPSYFSSPEGPDEWKVKDQKFFHQETADDVTEVISIAPCRPFATVSTYVTGAMKMGNVADPINEAALHEVEDYMTEQYALLQQDSNAYLSGLQNKRIILLDLLFLKTFYQIRLQRKNPDLEGFIDILAAYNKRIPQLTYEDLVITNPLEKDPRLFFNGKLGRSELSFYKGHNVIEQYFAPAVEKVREIIALCDTGEIDEMVIAEKEQEFNEARGMAMRSMGPFYKMNRDNFNIFRDFFATDTDRELRGASGAFSPAMPILDMLIGLNSLDTANEGYLQENLKLYPRDLQPEIQNAKQRFLDGKSLLAYAIMYNSEHLFKLYDTLGAALLRFREVHKNLVKTKAPDIYSGKIPGSGGFMVEEFLLKNIEVTKEKLTAQKNRIK